MRPPDANVRERALDISESFLVQAPAGSGKTELLTQRFLALLAAVDTPESIIAITFTRKAAGEMRNRISGALRKALEPAPEEPHAQRTWNLARAALDRDTDASWGLLDNPSRLRVMTIDSLCASLTSQMPWMSRMGGTPTLVDDPGELHRLAALRTLALLEQDTEYQPLLARLLLHIDNNLPRTAELLMQMLARRDQWLRHIAGGLNRAHLEASLAAISEAALEQIRHRVPFNAWDLMAYAQINTNGATDLERHQALAGFLLTQEGLPRKRITKNEGFPAKDPRKPEMESLCANLDPAFAAGLYSLRALPPGQYSDKQWAIIEALSNVLHLAVAQLRLVFQERRATDFVELTLSATQALGTDAEPTPLAYALDFRIQHLLLDEFQDTSRSKLALLERLVADWMPGDGRTVFAVGDPMQSIYSFQEADVSLFEQCRRRGLGRLPLESLVLRANFRSSRNLVDWFNSTFPGVLAPEDDPASGAVAYSPSTAQRGEFDGPPVECHPVTPEDEPGAVADAVEKAEGRVAILVRRRADAHAIVAELKRRHILFQAVEMDPLAERSIIQDLRALTRALLHPADRVAWLSVLRAPWCGLELVDLIAIAASASIPGVLPSQPSPRVQRVAPILIAALENRRRRPLRRHVEETWRALGGPACLRDRAEEEDANTFFGLLDKLDKAGDLPDLKALDDALAKLCATADPTATDRIQVMTMHKSKGLEFDNVILPGLSNRPRVGNSALLRWRETDDLVIGCIRESGADRDAVYDYLGAHEKGKAEHEAGRLLYVAATRAKKRLHLFGGQAQNGSFLARLWHAVGDQFPAPANAQAAAAVALSAGVPLRRVPEGFAAPAPPPALEWHVAERRVDESAEPYSADNETFRIIGTLVHRVLQIVAQQGLAVWSPERVAEREPALRAQLSVLGVPRAELDAAVTRTAEILRQTLASERGRWVLAAHPEAVSEWELSGVFGGDIYSRKLDRSFVADGIRWIVDYKTGGNDARYRAQLEQYAELVSRLDSRPIRLGLYFPLTGAWHEWEPTLVRRAGSATGQALD
ncbi:MAG: UvrD-helicase domain-containing protein [Bryobacterales bacterium]|nr:UvrD-helicase domain-containing protein [Bryobacterales bacterium]